MKSLFLIKPILTVSAAVLLVLCSCTKHPEPSPSDPVTPSRQLRKLEYTNPTSFLEGYDYNNDGLMSRIRNGNSYTAAISISYDTDKRPVFGKMISDYDSSIINSYEFHYIAGVLDEIRHFNGSSNSGNAIPNLIEKFQYRNSRLSTIVLYGGGVADDRQIRRISYSYDSKGNIFSETRENYDLATNSYRFAREVEYTYDDKANPLRGQAVGIYGFGSCLHPGLNNRIREVEREGDNRVTVAETTRSFTYDADGFPVTVLQHSEFPSDPSAPSENAVLRYVY